MRVTLKLNLKVSGLLRKSPHGLKDSVLLGKFLVDLESFLGELGRGRAEKEPRISIPVPAVPVSELLAGKNQ